MSVGLWKTAEPLSISFCPQFPRGALLATAYDNGKVNFVPMYFDDQFRAQMTTEQQIALHQARAWRHMWYHYRKAAALGLRVPRSCEEGAAGAVKRPAHSCSCVQVHRLAYENLLEPRGRLGALARLVEFVLRGERSEEQPPPDSQRHEQRQQRQQRRSEPPLTPKTSPPPGRIACAFSLACGPRC